MNRQLSLGGCKRNLLQVLKKKAWWLGAIRILKFSKERGLLDPGKNSKDNPVRKGCFRRSPFTANGRKNMEKELGKGLGLKPTPAQKKCVMHATWGCQKKKIGGTMCKSFHLKRWKPHPGGGVIKKKKTPLCGWKQES